MIRPKSGNTTPQNKNRQVQFSKPKVNNFLKSQNIDLKCPPSRLLRSSNSMGLNRPTQASSQSASSTK